ncbi:MAG TPA: hypothetical protein PKA95_03510 [Thermomicrobiales bacterium]|nr:hypothetical protein [Thermomicrobiales bacterium]
MTRRSRTRVAVLISTLVLLLLPASVVATHDGTAPEKWPAWYNGVEILTLMGPSGNSQNPNQLPSRCFGPGPDFRKNKDIDGLPVMYAIHSDSATQIACPDGSLMHDMILSVAPGDPGYQPLVGWVHCFEGPNFDPADMPYTSAAAVQAGAAGGELTCGAPVGPVYISPVVGDQH